jgi:hypothetical protein
MAKRRRKKNKNIFLSFLRYIGLALLYIFKGIVWSIRKLLNLILTKRVRQTIAVKGKQHHQPEYKAFEEKKTIEGDLQKFAKHIETSKSLIGIILGARGSGKSAIGMKILENVRAKTSRKVCAIGFKAKDLPDWITIINDPNELPSNAFVLIDEGGITFSSRESMSEPNKLLTELLLIARHKDLSVLFISQNSANIEINTIRQADYLLLKPHSLLQLDFERKKIKDIYKEVEEDIKEFKSVAGITYVYSDKFRGFMTNALPSFWSTKVSKAYEGYKKEKKE